jgi:hypothetical protein
MTAKRKPSRTGNVWKLSRPMPPLYDWPTDWDTYNMMKPPSVPRFRPGEYVITGYCGICLRRIAAIQPGGLYPTHVETGTEICSTKRKDQNDQKEENLTHSRTPD